MKKYLAHFTNRGFTVSLLWAFAFLIMSLVLNFYAGQYASQSASNAVTDIVLSNTRVYDVDAIVVYGAILFWVGTLLLGLRHPQRLPFLFKSVAVFIFFRAIFISLTHIGPYPQHVVITSRLLDDVMFSGDLFFSGHTGIPFLMSLIFWRTWRLRWIFIGCSLVFGAAVLLGHLHYTIDVVAAFFITYSIFKICERLFVADQEMFLQTLHS